jgi:HK97 family phage major capsid protein
MKKAAVIKAELAELESEVAAVLSLAESESRELTAEELETVESAIGKKDDQSDGKIAAKKAELARAEKFERFKAAEIKARFGELPTFKDDPLSTNKIPATPKNTGKLKHFKSESEAYAAGQFLLAAVYDNAHAKSWCNENGMVLNDMRSDQNAKGGFLIPQPLANVVVELREQFGVMRRSAQVWPMSSATESIPKVAGEVTAYFTAQLEDITESDMNLNQVQLQAKDLYTLIPVSAQVSVDAVVSVAELIARSIAQAQAAKEDECGFNGDGTSPFGHINGLSTALTGLSRVTATSQTSFGALTLASFEAVKGRVKRYAGMQPAWYISSTGFYASMDRLMNAAGGNTNLNLAAGSPMNFLGDPVIFTQVMESGLGSNTGKVACYYGDMRMSVLFGDRAGMAIDSDRSIFFRKNAIAIRSWSRFDINVHETGSAESAGSMVAMIFG